MGHSFSSVSVPLQSRAPGISNDEALHRHVADRVRMVLGTRPGRLPWKPSFGCDLDSFVGEPVTPQARNEIRRRIEHAISRWLPEIKVVKCDVQMRHQAPQLAGGRDRAIPLAEAALLRLGPMGALEVQLSLETEYGAMSMQAMVAS